MIHDFRLRCSSQLGTQPNLVHHNRYQIPFLFYLRANIFIWPLHHNEALSVIDLCLIPFDSLIHLSFILMLWTDIGTRDNITSASRNAVSAWSGQVNQCFCGVPYIILIYAESTVLEIFIPPFPPPINLITIPNLKEKITALVIIILSDTWHDFHILLIAVDISCNTRRGFC